MNEDQPRRIAVWCAVSSRQQAEPDKASLEDQERRGREFAASHGWPVVAVYAVRGHSRDYVLYEDAARDMPAYVQLREDIEAGRFDVLYAIDVDRLGRTPALALTVQALVETNGGEVYLASSPHEIGQRTISHQYVSAIQSVRAGEMQEIRTRRHRTGMAARIQRGLMPSNLPTGYTVLRDASGRSIGAELNEDAAVVLEVTRLYVQGMAMAEIVRQLEGNGWLPPNGRQWSTATLHRWVHMDVYAGVPRWGDVVADEPSDRFPPLWDEDLYQAVLRERAARRAAPRRQTRGTPFLDVAFCARCEGRMTKCVGRRAEGSVVYARCSTHANSFRHIYASTCHPNYVRETVLRDVAIAALAEITDLDALAERLDASTGEDYAAKMARVEMQLTRLQQERERLAEAMAAGQMDVDIYTVVDGRKRAQVEVLDDRWLELRRLSQQKVSVPMRFESAQEVREMLTQRWGHVPAPQINSLLRRVGLRLWCEDGVVVAVDFSG